MEIESRFQDAIQRFWTARGSQRQKQIDSGKSDTGSRGAATEGAQMGAIEALVTDLLLEAGLDNLEVRTPTALELPGYSRSQKS